MWIIILAITLWGFLSLLMPSRGRNPSTYTHIHKHIHIENSFNGKENEHGSRIEKEDTEDDTFKFTEEKGSTKRW